MAKKIIIILLLAYLSYGWQYYLYDTSLGNNINSSDYSGWEAPNTYTTKCRGEQFFGGKGHFGRHDSIKKSWSNVPEHFKLKVQARVAFLGSWDNEHFEVKINDHKQFDKQVTLHKDFQEKACESEKGRFETIEFEMYHTQNQFELQFKSLLNEDKHNESWAIRDVKIYLAKCEGNCNKLSDEFTEQSSSWNYNDWELQNSHNFVHWCGSTKIFGENQKFNGYKNPKKTIKNLSTNAYKVIVTYQLYLKDTFDDNERVEMLLRNEFGLFVLNRSIKRTIKEKRNIRCSSDDSGAWYDIVVDVAIEFPVLSNKDVILEIWDNLNSGRDNESWGIANLKIFELVLEYNSKSIVKTFHNGSIDYDSWTGSNIQKSYWNGINLIGGDKRFGKQDYIERNLEHLPPHNKLLITFKVGHMGSQDDNDYITVKLGNGIEVKRFYKRQWQTNIISNNENWTFFILEVDHFNLNDNIQIQSYFHESRDNESWGIADIGIFAINEENASFQYGLESVTAEKPMYFDFWNLDSYASALKKEGSLSVCKGNQILGGHKKFGKEPVSFYANGLPLHESVVVYFRLFLVDSWDPTEEFYIQVDDYQTVVVDKTFRDKEGIWQKLCGDDYHQDNSFYVKLTFAHQLPRAKITFSSNLNESKENESWGIRDLYVYTENDIQYK